ncbi:sigma-70 family RNA polymerase sigma factor [Bacilli bacterium]|nr:sigma-70 family RNA polymerase sigma factor [Oceanobacillus caeni]PZD84345.1 sigma-70 family RNA polymerase sigma factor [Bacilli bacterium]PZD86038.1 sigma-70 family RNA polymerase sigma factor [Bacilli bacterium]PZD89260.1 sigma-70 family RNA polymerase sigma factor [Bacilli bacterium]RCO05217.1 sigma-70 family RNA polymerase sigma factor [Bacilli bacterium]
MLDADITFCHTEKKEVLYLKKNDDLFEDIFKQNEKRIYYHMHKLGIRDPYGDFYSEGMYAMWTAYQKYEPNKGPLATYFNYTIRNRLIDLIRKKTNDEDNEQNYVEKEILTAYDGNKYGDSKMPILDTSGMDMEDGDSWERVFSLLTEKQRKWVYFYIIRDMSLKEIAEQEHVSVEAVKDWGKQARKKLRAYFKDRDGI